MRLRHAEAGKTQSVWRAFRVTAPKREGKAKPNTALVPQFNPMTVEPSATDGLVMPDGPSEKTAAPPDAPPICSSSISLTAQMQSPANAVAAERDHCVD
jgi:hypothetical protein